MHAVEEFFVAGGNRFRNISRPDPVVGPMRRRPVAGIVAGIIFAGLFSYGAGLDREPKPTAFVVPDPASVYDPTERGEVLPDGYRLALDRDTILPVYAPAFTATDLVDWPGDMLVIGVAGDRSAKAYPVTHLNSREMVIDSLEGIPILVTW